MHINYKLIFERRKFLGLSQIELSKGVTHQSNISKIESGEIVPNIDVLDSLLKKLYLRYDEVVLREKNLFEHLLELETQIEDHVHTVSLEMDKINKNQIKSLFELRLYYIIHSKININYRKYDEAGFYAGKVLEQKKGPKDHIYFMAKTIKGIEYAKLNKFLMAEDYFKTVEKYLREIDFRMKTANSVEHMRMYMALVEFYILKKDFNSAEKTLEKLIYFVKQSRDFSYLSEILLLNLKIQNALKDFTKSKIIHSATKIISELLGKEKVLRKLKDFNV
jgi:transcriptional regulator with XRE-family HTH domain